MNTISCLKSSCGSARQCPPLTGGAFSMQWAGKAGDLLGTLQIVLARRSGSHDELSAVASAMLQALGVDIRLSL